jgi:hypothetical protein
MRRAVFILVFLLFIAGVVWYALAYVSVPKMTFAEAAAVGDAKKKVMIVGKVLPEGQSTPQEGEITFYMVDGTGAKLKVSLEGRDAFTPGQLNSVAKSQSEISIAGHSHGEYFHASDIFFPSN